MYLNFQRTLAIAVVASSSWIGGNALAQQAGGTGTGTGTGQPSGITQTGESTSFSIERVESVSVVAPPETNFLSKPTTGFGTVQGFGSFSTGGGTTGLGGLSTLGGGRGGGIGGGIGGFGLGAGFGNQFGGNQFGGQQTLTGTAGTLPLRHRIRVDIAIPPRTITRISREFARRLTRLPGLTGMTAVAVTMEGQTAVLTGSVDSIRVRDLVARLAMFEPGIAAVRNELSVTPSAAPPESLQTPSS